MVLLIESDISLLLSEFAVFSSQEMKLISKVDIRRLYKKFIEVDKILTTAINQFSNIIDCALFEIRMKQ